MVTGINAKVKIMLRQLRQIALITGLWVVLVFLFFGTNPADLPMYVLVTPFIILFAALFLTSRLAISKLFPQMLRQKKMLIAIFLAVLPCLLLVLSSINQLTWRDATLLISILFAVLLYGNRLRLTGQ